MLGAILVCDSPDLMCLFLLICFHCICKTFLLPICVVASATINRFLFTKNECSIHNSIMCHVINNKGILRKLIIMPGLHSYSSLSALWIPARD